MSKRNNSQIIKLLLISIFLLKITSCSFQDSLKIEISNYFGPLTEESTLEIKNAFEKIKNYIQSNKNHKRTSDNGFLSEKLSPNDHKDGIICRGCLKLYGLIQSLLLKKYGWSVLFEFASLLCSLGLNKQVCNRYIHAYGEIVVESLIEHYLNAEFICTFTFMCRYKHFINLNADDFAREILADKPTPNNNFSRINTQAVVWKVLHVADIHVDLQYEVGTRGLCPYQLCCRKESKQESYFLGNANSLKNSSYNQTLAGKYGFIGLCDIPLTTLENFAEEVFLKIKPDFIIWTGDNPGHDAYDQSAFEVAKIFTEIIKMKYNYTLPVYPSLGNHENYPADEYNPFNNTQQTEFLTPYGQLFRDWIGEEGYHDFTQFGAYTKLHPGSNLRIISTNCMLCDSLNFFLIRNPTDPQTQIEWMEKILRQAEKDGEIIYLVSHIPPGDVTLLSECSKRLKAVIERFSHIIRGQFYGHTHYDELKVMTNYFDNSKVSSISYIAPSLTT
jgi:sphingomyelin phosphodiesterase